MLTKLGFVVLVLAFGAAAFVAGLLAPTDIRGPIVTVAERCTDVLKRPYARAVYWVFGRAAPTPEQCAVGDYRALLLTNPGDASAQYGVQVGLYGSTAQALDASKMLTEQGYPSQLVAVGTESTTILYVLAAGPFATLSAARSALVRLGATSLPHSALLPIRLPNGSAGAQSSGRATPPLPQT